MNRFHVFFPAALSKKIRSWAKREGISVSELVRRAMTDYAAKQK